jgi:hypothetical protein
MPLPVGQITVFLAIAIPYTLILTLAGMPFSHTWIWLYALPPGAAAWLVTRPVLEGKRLPELVLSQLRYLAEPRIWCRLMPVAEKDHVIVLAQVWRAPARPERPGPVTAAEPDAEPQSVPARPAWPHRPALSQLVRARAVSAAAVAAAPPAAARAALGPTVAETATSAAPGPAVAETAASAAPGPAVAETGRGGRTVVTVRAGSQGRRAVHIAERAGRTSPADPRTGWRDRVVVVPGGLRPAKPDHIERDQARVRLPLPGPVRIVVLGSSAGAGQTVTALLTGQLLARLRGEPVAVLDLSSGPGSVTELARQIPRLLPGRQPAGRTHLAGRSDVPGERALQVVTAEHSGSGPRDADQLIDAVCARYPLTIADPSAADVPRALQVADQLVLVSPAGADGAGSLAMTLEWLEAHDHGRLVRASCAVLNGVSAQTAAHAERAAGVAVGRCRAVVRVPWDGALSSGGALSGETVRALTALAGVLISGLAAGRPADGAAAATPSAGPAAARTVSR